MNKQQTIAALQKLAGEQQILAQLYEDIRDEISEEAQSSQTSNEPNLGEKFHFNVTTLTAAIDHINGISTE